MQYLDSALVNCMSYSVTRLQSLICVPFANTSAFACQANIIRAAVRGESRSILQSNFTVYRLKTYNTELKIFNTFRIAKTAPAFVSPALFKTTARHLTACHLNSQIICDMVKFYGCVPISFILVFTSQQCRDVNTALL